VIKRSTLLAATFLATGAVGALFVAPGCSSKSTDPAPVPGGDYTPIVPPKKPAATATGSTKWFVVNALKLGLTNKLTGAVKPDAWKDYGFDLDGRNTTADMSPTSQNSCKRRSGSPTKVLLDGNGGIDNNFGQHVMAVIKSLKADAEDAVTKSVTDGKFTLVLRVDNATNTDNASAPGALYVANDFVGADGKPAAPAFSPTEVWPINAASLSDGKTIGQPKLSFPKGYIANGYWVSGELGTETISLSISLSGASIELPIDSGVITVKLADGKDGTIAGAMNTGKLKDALTPVAKRFGICPGNATYDQVVETLTQSADLVSGAPQLQNTAIECDAISIAIGFSMMPAGDHSKATVITSVSDPGPDDCSGEGGETGKDSGTDTGSGDTATSTDSASDG
jgi:hypothetical protein